MELIKNSDYVHPFFSLQIPAFELFESKLMHIRKEHIEESFRKIQNLSRKMEQEDGTLYADIRIVNSYFEKLLCIVQGMAEKELFREINKVALNDYRSHPELTSANLFEVVLAAGISLN